MYETAEYIDAVTDVVATAIENKVLFHDIEPAVFAQIANEHNLEQYKVIDDAIDIYDDMLIMSEIEAEHEKHLEDDPPLTPEQLIESGAVPDYADVMTTDEFIEQVKCGYIIDYDGQGEFVSGNGKETRPVHCVFEWLEEFKDEWPYVAWYNR